eukprot:scaffold14982_cov62-Phaeocystis_antarctica.AAC.5
MEEHLVDPARLDGSVWQGLTSVAEEKDAHQLEVHVVRLILKTGQPVAICRFLFRLIVVRAQVVAVCVALTCEDIAAGPREVESAKERELAIGAPQHQLSGQKPWQLAVNQTSIVSLLQVGADARPAFREEGAALKGRCVRWVNHAIAINSGVSIFGLEEHALVVEHVAHSFTGGVRLPQDEQHRGAALEVGGCDDARFRWVPLKHAPPRVAFAARARFHRKGLLAQRPPDRRVACDGPQTRADEPARAQPRCEALVDAQWPLIDL